MNNNTIIKHLKPMLNDLIEKIKIGSCEDCLLKDVNKMDEGCDICKVKKPSQMSWSQYIPKQVDELVGKIQDLLENGK